MGNIYWKAFSCVSYDSWVFIISLMYLFKVVFEEVCSFALLFTFITIVDLSLQFLIEFSYNTASLSV